MAVGIGQVPIMNGTEALATPLELAIDLPHAPGTRVNLHLTVQHASILLFLTSTNPDTSNVASPMGSFVFAMPDKYNPSQPLSTIIYSVPSSLDFTTRMAKVLARKLNRPCYVGSSIDLSGMAAGGSTEEEIVAFRAVVQTVVAECEKQNL